MNKADRDEPKIMTLSPDGKKAVNILQRRYNMMKEAILTILQNKDQVTLTELHSLV